MDAESSFVPVHVERTGTLRVALPLREAFGFFSPEGERRWVAGWAPRYLHPPGTPSDAAGTVFTTDHNHEDTVWLVLRYSPVEAVAEYARLTPGSRVGTVTVTAVAQGDATEVQVTYRLTSLSPKGNEALDAMTPEAYAAMLREWESLIARPSS